ncbi:MAG: hypothetical protein AAF865_10560 [Pseudomonadota bacterium]
MSFFKVPFALSFGARTFVFGDNDANTIDGTAGRDTIFARGGDDLIRDGAGRDTVFAGNGNDLIEAGTGQDSYFGGSGQDAVSFRGQDAAVSVNLVLRKADTENGDKRLFQIEDITGSDFADTINGDRGDNVLEGAGGSDTLTGGAGADTFAFSGDPFDGADVSAEGRQIIGNEDFITDFDFTQDSYRIDAADFGISGDVSFAAVNATDPAAQIPLGANVIVLTNADNDADPTTPFLAGTAAAQIADLVDQDGAGLFVYFNSVLGVNRLVYSENLNDASADLKILSRQTDLTGQDAIEALNAFDAQNFEFVNVETTDDVFALTDVVDGTVIDGGTDTNGATATEAGDIATGDTIDLSALSDGVNVDLDASNQGALNNLPESEVGVLSQGDAVVELKDIENVIGTGFDDTLFGNNEANVIFGGDGDDNIHPFGGTDFVDGGAGTDTLNLSAATGINVDLAAGIAGPNTFVNFENVLGSVNGADVIFGDAGGNDLNGRGDDDLLNGRGGSDTLTGGDGADAFAFSGDPFDGADVSDEGRQIIGAEDFITDFTFEEDRYQIDAADFLIDTPLIFTALDGNAPGAEVAEGANVIVLTSVDNDDDPSTPFLAGTAANQIAELVDSDGAGLFIYHNSNLEQNRLVYSENLNDASADLKILSRHTDLTGQDAVDVLGSFSADNFEFV